jgi:predicted O-methyltransferase YrrM
MKGNAPASFITGVPGWETDAEQTILLESAQRVPANGLIVEIGGEFGQSSSIFSKGATAGNIAVVSVDLFPDDVFEAYMTNMMEAKLTNAPIAVPGNSREITLADVLTAAHLNNSKKIDLLFIDGDHTYEGALADLENWAQHVKKGGVLLVHDCACATNKAPHYLHFEVTRALSWWFEGQKAKWQAIGSVDSLMIFERVK